MAKKINLTLTKRQFDLLVESIINHETMAEVSDEETAKEFKLIVRNLDRMLKANGYKRKFKKRF